MESEGFRPRDHDQLSAEELYAGCRSDAFGKEVQRRLLLGAFVLSRRSYESFYKKAQQIRSLVCSDFEAAFRQGINCILTPTSPSSAFPLTTDTSTVHLSSPVEQYVHDIMTVPASLAGLPSISVPTLIQSDTAGNCMPLGLQLIAPPLQEDQLFVIARCLETPNLHKVVPPQIETVFS